MALYKESMLNKIEDDLQGRNQNWEMLETHLAESVADDVHGWTSAARYTVGRFARSALEPSGRQKIVTGFRPQAVIAIATVNGSTSGRYSVGFGYPGANFCFWKDIENKNQTTISLIVIRQGATSSHQYSGSIVEMYEDGFDINWIKGGNAIDEVISVGYLAFR